MAGQNTCVLHATAVAIGDRAVLITGASGSGKSSLALEMMARGASLVADDQVQLCSDGDTIELTCPAPLRGMIEARGIGLLHSDCFESARLALVVDLDATEPTRFPPHRHRDVLGIKVPLVHKVASGHFPAAVIQYLKGYGRVADQTRLDT